MGTGRVPVVNGRLCFFQQLAIANRPLTNSGPDATAGPVTPDIQRRLFMTSSRRPRLRTVALVVIGLLMMLSYTVVFARQIRCQLVEYTQLRHSSERIYVDPAMPDADVRRLDSMLGVARDRDIRFLGALQAVPTILAGHDSSVIEDFGQQGNRYAATHVHLGNAFIVLGPDGLQVDVIAHEMVHAELAARIGWFDRERLVPAWFDEGLAMQVDRREDFSEQVWLRERATGRATVPLEELSSGSDFGAEDGWWRFTVARHEVARWLAIVGRDGLDELLRRIDNGAGFLQAYRAIEAGHVDSNRREVPTP